MEGYAYDMKYAHMHGNCNIHASLTEASYDVGDQDEAKG